MKSVRIKNVPILVFVLTLSISCTLKDQDGRESKVSQDAPVTTRSGLSWDYPVKGGTAEWKMLQSYEEMVKVCQIPEGILRSLSTDDLTEICLQYPLLFCIFHFNRLSDGLDKMFSEFNGMRELYARKDMSIGLISRYVQKVQSFSFLDEAHTDASKGVFIISVSILEALLSRVTQHENSSYKEILQCLVDGYERKWEYADDFSGLGFSTNFFARANVMTKMDPQFVSQLPGNDKNSVFYSGWTDEQTIGIINELSYQLMK